MYFRTYNSICFFVANSQIAISPLVLELAAKFPQGEHLTMETSLKLIKYLENQKDKGNQ